MEYRPRKRDKPRPKAAETSPPFAAVEFEPVSVRQMEKEFRMAVRNDARTGRKGSPLKRLKALFSRLVSIFKSKDGSKPRQRPSGRRGSRPQKQPHRPQGQQETRDGGRQDNRSGSSNRRRRRNRSRNPRPDNREGGGNQQARKDGRKSHPQRRGNRPPGRSRHRPGGSGNNKPDKQN